MKGRKKIFKKRKLVNFWIEEEIWKKFKKYTKEDGLNASGIIRQFIIRKVKGYEKKN